MKNGKVLHCDNFALIHLFMDSDCCSGDMDLLFCFFLFSYFLDLVRFFMYFMIQWRLQVFSSFSFLSFLLLLQGLCMFYAWFCTLYQRDMRAVDVPWNFPPNYLWNEPYSLWHFNSLRSASPLWTVVNWHFFFFCQDCLFGFTVLCLVAFETQS